MKFPFLKTKAYYYFTVLLITAICYVPVINNEWVNWDDDHYVLENKSVQDLTFQNLIGMFHHNKRVMDTYTPLPLISFSLEYALVKDDPQLYHINNLLLHLINTALVLLLIFLLTSNIWVASFTALFFGIHPMHVESVAWITERKDLLMALFFLLSCISYLKFIKEVPKHKTIYYLLSLFFFVLSIFSKPQLASLPFILILFDWWFSRKFTRKILFEKLPFFAIALAIGIFSMIIVDPVPLKYVFVDRFLFSSYAVLIYIVKFIFPYDLSVIYDLPEKMNGFYPDIVYLSLPITIALVAIPIYFMRKHKFLFFGFAFFFVTIGLALHLLKLTTSVIYERYTYLPYIGLLFIIAYYVDKRIKKNGRNSKILIGGISIIIICSLGFLTFNRSAVWQNSKTLWTDVIVKKPNNYFAYSKRGLYYISIENWDKALMDFNKSLKLNPAHDESLNNRGFIKQMKGDYEAALADFNKAIELNPTYEPALVNLGILYREFEDYKTSLNYFRDAISLNPYKHEYYLQKAVTYKRAGDFIEAINNYSKAIEIESGIPSYYYNRGYAYCLKGDFKSGIDDFSIAILLNPDYALAWFDRSIARYNISSYSEALNDALKARELGYDFKDEYLTELKIKNQQYP